MYTRIPIVLCPSPLWTLHPTHVQYNPYSSMSTITVDTTPLPCTHESLQVYVHHHCGHYALPTHTMVLCPSSLSWSLLVQTSVRYVGKRRAGMLSGRTAIGRSTTNRPGGTPSRRVVVSPPRSSLSRSPTPCEPSFSSPSCATPPRMTCGFPLPTSRRWHHPRKLREPVLRLPRKARH